MSNNQGQFVTDRYRRNTAQKLNLRTAHQMVHKSLAAVPAQRLSLCGRRRTLVRPDDSFRLIYCHSNVVGALGS